jgi:hypothetical protein
MVVRAVTHYGQPAAKASFYCVKVIAQARLGKLLEHHIYVPKDHAVEYAALLK